MYRCRSGSNASTSFVPVRYLSTKKLEGLRRDKRTPVHGPHHACNKSIDTPTLLDKRNQGRNAAFIVCGMPEVRKDHLLEGFDLVLQSHKIGYCFIANHKTTLGRQDSVNEWHAPLIGIVDSLQRHIFFVLE